MKASILSLVLIAATASAQVVQFRYRDPSGDLTVAANGGKMVRVERGYRLNLEGNVSVQSKSQGLKIESDAVEANLVGESRLRLSTITTTRPIQIVKSSEGRSTTVRGSKGKLTSGTGADTIQLSGPVTIKSTNASKRQTLDASGSAGTAILDNSSSNKGTLTTATLEGPVNVVLVEVGAGESPSTIIAKGRRLVITENGKVVSLTGGVSIEGKGPRNIGTFSQLGKATFRLNSAGEVISFETEAGS